MAPNILLIPSIFPAIHLKMPEHALTTKSAIFCAMFPRKPRSGIVACLRRQSAA